MMTEMTIQAVAKQTGLTIYTLRWYEKIGLIPPVRRAPNGHRLYTEEDVSRIVFITRLRDTDMPIAKIKRYVDLSQQEDAAIDERLNLLEAQRDAIRVRITELSQTLEYIESKIQHYREYNKEALMPDHVPASVGET